MAEKWNWAIFMVNELFKDLLNLIVGVVADILKTETKYEMAIETALGGNIQNVVTLDEEVAKRMITYLKQQKAGRVTFLPLTSIKNPQTLKSDECLKEPGVIGLADTLVQVEDKYINVAKSLLGRFIVVDHIDGSRHNNNVDNLRILTRAENAIAYYDIKNNHPNLAKRNARNGIWYTINDDHTYNFHRSWYMANDEAPGKEIYFQKYGVNVEPEIVK